MLRQTGTADLLDRPRRQAGERRWISRLAQERGLGLISVLVEMIYWSTRENLHTGAEEDFVREATEDREGLIRRLQQHP